MASGLEMYHALKKAIGGGRVNGVLRINRFDREDLCKLTTKDLVSVGFDDGTARQVSTDLSQQSLDSLGRAMGVELMVQDRVLDLIPGEGIKRAAETLKDDPQTFEEMLEELRHMRHPVGEPK